MILAVTGHRPDKIGGYDRNNPLRKKLLVKIDATLARLKPERVLTGMALGVDQDVA